MAKCEDYPACGHTDQDPCERQWYDEPGAFDTSRPGNEHALCDHENGICEVNYDFDDDDEDEVELQHEMENERQQRLHDEMIANDPDPFFGP